MTTATKGRTAADIASEETQAQELEGVKNISSRSALFKKLKRREELAAEIKALQDEEKAIKLELRDVMNKEDLREIHFNGAKVVGISERTSKKTDLDLLGREWPEIFRRVVSFNATTQMNFSHIKG